MKQYKTSQDFAHWLDAWKQRGCPEMIICMGAGVGDDLMCTAILRELRVRGHRNVWIATAQPELFLDNPDVDAILPMYFDPGFLKLLLRTKCKVIYPNYIVNCKYLGETPEGTRKYVDIIHPGHVISRVCQKAGIVGRVALRPYLYLTPEEQACGVLAPDQVAIISVGVVPEKSWYWDRFNEVVDALRSRVNFVQLGSESNPLLDNVIDMRGKTTLREAAAILSQSLVFVGVEGGLMHMARAVDCSSVIVYGARTLPWQTGYGCNQNLVTLLSCAGCWRRYACDRDLECLDGIKPSSVIDAVVRAISQPKLPLNTDYGTILYEDVFSRDELFATLRTRGFLPA